MTIDLTQDPAAALAEVERLSQEAARANPMRAPTPALAASPDTDGLEGLRTILAALVPESGARVTWFAADGVEHSAPTFLAARKQIVLAGLLRGAASDLTKVTKVFGEGEIGAEVVLRVLAEPKLLDTLVSAFETIHPGAKIEAYNRAVRDGATPPVATPEQIPSADEYFPIEEMIKAVVPFFARPALVLIGLAQPAR